METEETTTEFIELKDQVGNIVNVMVDPDGLPACDYQRLRGSDTVYIITASTAYDPEAIIGVFIDEELARDALDDILSGAKDYVAGRCISAREYLLAIEESPSSVDRGVSALDYLNRQY